MNGYDISISIESSGQVEVEVEDAETKTLVAQLNVESLKTALDIKDYVMGLVEQFMEKP